MKLNCDEFLERLASKEPVPGGGGAAALGGAIGAALTSMVANLTVGKEKFFGFPKGIQPERSFPFPPRAVRR